MTNLTDADERSSDEKTADHRQAVSIAGRIRDYWKQLGLDVKVEFLPDGSIRSDMVGGRPVRRVEHL